jgi:hypothetical protein
MGQHQRTLFQFHYVIWVENEQQVIKLQQILPYYVIMQNYYDYFNETLIFKLV